MTYPDVNSWAADRYADEMGDLAELEELQEYWEAESGGLDVLEDAMRDEDALIDLLEKPDFLDRIVNFCLNDSEMVEHLKGMPYYRGLIDAAFERYVEGLKDDY